MKRIWNLVALLSLAGCAVSARSASFEIGETDFLLDGRPFRIHCGEAHYARIPRAYWRHRLRMLKAMGMNAVGCYMFWNYHEREPGKFTWEGRADAAAFCRTAQEEGLWVVLRPGPYACAEWEGGGAPAWLLKDDRISMRSSDPKWTGPATRWIAEVGRVLAPLQVTRGGPILMVQVENEYGLHGNDAAYIETLRKATVDAGFEVPLYACNPPRVIRNGFNAKLFQAANFGGDPEQRFGIVREVQPKGPLMCAEYYPAWFDTWGAKHNGPKRDRDFFGPIDWMLDRGASFSLYMAHGGTSFGWWAGCNAPFRPQTSSYDYDAPVSEAGLKHPEKFAAMRGLFARYLNDGETIPDAPKPPAFQSAVCEATPEKASLWNVQKKGAAKTSKEPLSFEQIDLGYGYCVYRTTVPAGLGGELKADVRDLGVVRLDKKVVGFFDRRFPKASIRVKPADEARTLEILVEPMGRYNFGHIMHESRKGVIGPVTLGGAELTSWEMFPVNLNEDKRGGLAKIGPFGPSNGRASSGAVYRYAVNLKAQDTYLDMHDWKRGQVRVNGHWIGRYWSIGPTQTMYVPGCYLKDGENEIVIIDVVGVKPPASLKFVATPVLGEMRPETDYFSFQPRPRLAEKLSSPVHEGEFSNDTTRQDVRFKKPARGRFFALESLSAWDGKEYAAGGEIDLVDAEGKNISHAKWTIAACDSEERLAEDGSAENLVDGQTANLWHTEWKAKSPNHPHYVVIDLGQEETVGGMNFTPRQSNGGGRIRRYRAYVLPSVKTK